jgi:hypothetical protein
MQMQLLVVMLRALSCVCGRWSCNIGLDGGQRPTAGFLMGNYVVRGLS